MTSLLLVRHGQIKANLQGLWHGSTDSPLTWRGRRQASRTARHIDRLDPGVTAIYTSPLGRCVETAGKIGKRLKIDPVVSDNLREYAIGEWEGLPFRVLAEEYDFVNKSTRNPEFAPPGGESLAQVAARIVPALQEIHTRHELDHQVLIVCHGAATAIALGSLIDGDPKHWINYQFANCGLTELVLSPSPYVNFFNATHHL
ncbi:MAG: histidine phosphatase family protein [Gammaproteobacteria bacterium]|nr:histidine phosphatase family protein [Gammaproteobacteria bacterium]